MPIFAPIFIPKQIYLICIEIHRIKIGFHIHFQFLFHLDLYWRFPFLRFSFGALQWLPGFFFASKRSRINDWCSIVFGWYFLNILCEIMNWRLFTRICLYPYISILFYYSYTFGRPYFAFNRLVYDSRCPYTIHILKIENFLIFNPSYQIIFRYHILILVFRAFPFSQSLQAALVSYLVDGPV